MSDFSLFSLFTAGLAFASGVAAYTKPTGDAPEGNPISQPGLMSIVPAGKAFTITWEPTTKGTVSLVLLKGPSENAVPQYAIVEKTDNDGSYAWTPSTDLEPTTDATGYGIQLIDDKTGQYQYTTQFGISNSDYNADESSSSTSEAITSSTAAPGGYGNGWGHDEHGHSQGGWGHSSHNVDGGYTHSAAVTGTASGMTSSHKANGTTSGGSAHPTGYTTKNVTMVAPTGATSSTKTVISSGPTATSNAGTSGSASSPAVPQATDNGAAGMVSSLGGLVLAAGAAVFVL